MVKRLFEDEGFVYPDASWFTRSDGIDAIDRVKNPLDREQSEVDERFEWQGLGPSPEEWARRLSSELVDLGTGDESPRTYSQSTPKYRKLEFD